MYMYYSMQALIILNFKVIAISIQKINWEEDSVVLISEVFIINDTCTIINLSKLLHNG